MRRPARARGFSLVEMVCATGVIVIGLLSLAGVMSVVAGQRDQASTRRLVLDHFQSMVEELRGMSPDALRAARDGHTRKIPGVTGAHEDGSVVSIEVDDTDPLLLTVTLDAAWVVGSHEESSTLVTKIYNSAGESCE